DVGVLAEERVGALRRGEPADPPQGRQVEPGVVLPGGVEVAVEHAANALQVERLENRIEPRLTAIAVRVWSLGLRLDEEARVPEEHLEVVEQEVPLDRH